MAKKGTKELKAIKEEITKGNYEKVSKMLASARLDGALTKDQVTIIKEWLDENKPAKGKGLNIDWENNLMAFKIFKGKGKKSGNKLEAQIKVDNMIDYLETFKEKQEEAGKTAGTCSVFVNIFPKEIFDFVQEAKVYNNKYGFCIGHVQIPEEWDDGDE